MALDLHGFSREAFDLIVAEEVSSEARYNARYRHPEWPGEQSGVTGGIGYDFGQQTRAQILTDWTGKIPDAMGKALAKTAGMTGAPARELALGLRDVVDIPWAVALDVFSNRDVPCYLAMTRAALPGFDALSPHCQGVLLSVVFNRGASFSLAGPRYAEMREIKACVRSGDLARIPALLRSMKRLWSSKTGLPNRREHEAVLFERGLAEHHPEAHAALPDVAAVPDPEMVERAQQQQRNLGYFQVGAVDGQATPKGKLEDAILAFRNRNGLPLRTSIDDEFLNALAKARPPEIAEERANASTADLRAQGSETISFTDKAKAWAGRIFGGSAGLGGAGTIAMVTEKATQVSDARNAIGALGLSTDAWLAIAAGVVVLVVLAGCGVAIWFVANRIEQKRLADYRVGKNP